MERRGSRRHSLPGQRIRRFCARRKYLLGLLICVQHPRLQLRCFPRREGQRARYVG